MHLRTHLRSAAPHRAWLAAAAACSLTFFLPHAALAQDNGGLGLDLSGDGSSKPPADSSAPAQSPASAPSDTATPANSAAESSSDLGASTDDGSAKPVTPGDKGGDITQSDVSLDDRVKSVQKKGFYKKHHLELAPHVGMTLNDAFFTKYNLGGSLIFHFSDALALGGRFDYMIVQTSANVATAKRELQSHLPVSKPKYGAGADFYWTPVYGKASLFNSIIHFDVFAVAGAGMVVSQTSSSTNSDNPLLNQGPHPAFDIGLGQRYGLNALVAFEWSLIETLYTDTPGGGGSQVQKILSLNAGLSIFLPPISSE